MAAHSWAGTSSSPLYHCTSSGKIVGSRAKYPFRLTVFFFLHPKANRPKDQRNNSQPQSKSLWPRSAFSCLHHCPFASQSGRTAGPPQVAHQGMWMCRAEEPQAACHSCSLPGSCLPLCLQGRYSHGASGQAPQGCITDHAAGASCPLWPWLLGPAALWPPWKGALHPWHELVLCSCPSLPCPGVRNYHAVPSPTAHIPLSSCSWQTPQKCSTVPDWRRQKGVGEGYSHQAVLSVWVKGTAIRLCSLRTIK